MHYGRMEVTGYYKIDELIIFSQRRINEDRKEGGKRRYEKRELRQFNHD